MCVRTFFSRESLSSFYVLPENYFLYKVYAFASCDFETAHKGFITYNDRLIIALTDVKDEVREKQEWFNSFFEVANSMN